VKALQLIAHGTPGKFELRDLPEPQPGPDDVSVEVKACGLNHLDLWLEEAACRSPSNFRAPRRRNRRPHRCRRLERGRLETRRCGRGSIQPVLRRM